MPVWSQISDRESLTCQIEVLKMWVIHNNLFYKETLKIIIIIVIPIKNRSSIIFDWSVGKQSMFFDHGISIFDFRSLSFGMIEWSIFSRFFLPMNMPSGNLQHCKSQKENFTFVFLFIYCYCYWLYRLIKFLRPINRFFDRFQPIKFFRFLKMIDHRLKSIKKLSMIGITKLLWIIKLTQK